MNEPVVKTKWGPDLLDELWQAIDWMMVNKNASKEVQRTCWRDLQVRMRAAVNAWKRVRHRLDNLVGLRPEDSAAIEEALNILDGIDRTDPGSEGIE
ncbi:MAG: hypothetical protein AMS21_00970 [Gemmatimonas sp. SG8_38_2]|nr:MAG: hypothetical protein AMS21_00970 [Gemmatimonas sp. SG8_38_2]